MSLVSLSSDGTKKEEMPRRFSAKKCPETRTETQTETEARPVEENAVAVEKLKKACDRTIQIDLKQFVGSDAAELVKSVHDGHRSECKFVHANVLGSWERATLPEHPAVRLRCADGSSRWFLLDTAPREPLAVSIRPKTSNITDGFLLSSGEFKLSALLQMARQIP